MFQVGVEKFSDLIKAHSVGGIPLCPASVYLELGAEALSAAQCVPPEHQFRQIDQVSFDRPLVYSELNENSEIVRIIIQPQVQRPKSAQFSITANESNHIYCSGSISTVDSQSVKDLLTLKSAYANRQTSTLLHSTSIGNVTLETFSSRTIYDIIFPRVVSYSEPFRTLQNLTISTSGLEGYGSFRLPNSHHGQFVCPPAFMDTMLHAAGFIANCRVGLETACICVSVDRIVLADTSLLPSDDHCMAIYCSLLDIGESTVADTFVMDKRGQVVSFAEGMRFKKLQLSSFKKVLFRASQPKKQQDRHEQGRSNVGQVSPYLPSRQGASAVTLRKQHESTSLYPGADGVIRELDQTVCGVSCDLPSCRTLAELGVDSLLFIELAQAITARFPALSIEKEQIERCKSVGGLARLISQAQEQREPLDEEFGHVEWDRRVSQVTNLPSPPTEPVASEMESEIQGLFMELCGRYLTEQDRGASLASLGVDSLLSIELIHLLRERFDLDLEALDLDISNTTVNNIEALCSTRTMSQVSSLGQNGPAAQSLKPLGEGHKHDPIISELIPAAFPHMLQTNDESSPSVKLPLYMFHDGSGLTSMYSRLKPLGREVRGIFSPDVLSIDPSVQSIQAMAAQYIDRADLMSQKRPILCGKF